MRSKINHSRWPLLVLLLLGSPLLEAADYNSTDQLPLMLELYTSEGCSSCPPAENYLNRLTSHPQLWKSLFPLAFHVDYWDNLGWKDRFSSASYSERQRDYARFHKRRTVYTPAFYANGNNWRANWYDRELPRLDSPKTGVLKVHLENNQLEAHYQPQQQTQQPLELHLAILGMGLSTQIAAGENAGRNAEHEFVVLDYIKTNSNSNHWQFNLASAGAFPAKQLALVAWVSSANTPLPLQVVGGPYMASR